MMSSFLFGQFLLTPWVSRAQLCRRPLLPPLAFSSCWLDKHPPHTTHSPTSTSPSVSPPSWVLLSWLPTVADALPKFFRVFSVPALPPLPFPVVGRGLPSLLSSPSPCLVVGWSLNSVFPPSTSLCLLLAAAHLLHLYLLSSPRRGSSDPVRSLGVCSGVHPHLSLAPILIILNPPSLSNFLLSSTRTVASL